MLNPFRSSPGTRDIPGTTRAAPRGPASLVSVCSWPDAAQTPFDEVGLRIGADHARLGITPPAEHLHPGNPVGEGWRRTLARHRRPRSAADTPGRLWLSLRLACWREGRVFDGFSVTPRWLAGLGHHRCAVTRRPFAQGGDAATPLVLFDGAACAAGNLALVGRDVAAQAQGLDSAAAYQRAEQAELSGSASGLQAAQWRRLASLRAMATPLPHAQASATPLHLMPPARCRVVNDAHALQVLVTAATAAGALVPGLCLESVASVLPRPALKAYATLASALLASRLGAPAGSADPSTPVALRTLWALEDAWSQALVQRRWSELTGTLDADACGRAVRALVQKLHSRRAPLRVKWLDEDAAFDGWSIEQAGRATTHTATLAGPQILSS